MSPQALSHISETVEMIMGVQRKWMYLESIFVGSEDIRKQAAPNPNPQPQP